MPLYCLKIICMLYLPNLAQRPEIGRAYHMTALGQTTWYDFAKAILEKASGVSHDLPWLAAATHGRPLIARQVIPISTEEFRSPTQRPAYSVLSNSRLIDTFEIALPDWHIQMLRCFAPENVDGPASFSWNRTLDIASYLVRARGREVNYILQN